MFMLRKSRKKFVICIRCRKGWLFWEELYTILTLSEHKFWYGVPASCGQQENKSFVTFLIFFCCCCCLNQKGGNITLPQLHVGVNSFEMLTPQHQICPQLRWNELFWDQQRKQIAERLMVKKSREGIKQADSVETFNCLLVN